MYVVCTSPILINRSHAPAVTPLSNSTNGSKQDSTSVIYQTLNHKAPREVESPSAHAYPLPPQPYISRISYLDRQAFQPRYLSFELSPAAPSNRTLRKNPLNNQILITYLHIPTEQMAAQKRIHRVLIPLPAPTNRSRESNGVPHRSTPRSKQAQSRALRSTPLTRTCSSGTSSSPVPRTLSTLSVPPFAFTALPTGDHELI
jgi:hypothetical protein